MKKLKKREARIADYEAMKSNGGQGHNRKWVAQANGKNALFTRPGSNKK